MTEQEMATWLILVALLSVALFVVLIYLSDKYHVWSKWWAWWFKPQRGGALIIVAFGTFGAREALRMVTTFAAAGAKREVLAVVMMDFHNEAFEYAYAIRKLLGKKQVILPINMPPGVAQGFMHKLEHPRTTREAWEREVERMVSQARQLDAANGSTTTTLIYILPPWSGHFPIAVHAVPLFKNAFMPPVLHMGRLNLPANEPKLYANWKTRDNYPDCLLLDGIIVSDEALDPHREIQDWSISAGISGLFAAGRVDPGQQHGANPLQDLVSFAQGSGGYIGVGVGQHTTALIPTLWGLRRVISEQKLSSDVTEAIKQALNKKAWSTPGDPSADVAHFVSVIVPLDPAHPQWRQAKLRRDAIKDLPNESLPYGCTAIWTYAAMDNGTKDRANIHALWLYPVQKCVSPLVPTRLGTNGATAQAELATATAT